MKKILFLGLLLFSCFASAQNFEFYQSNHIRFLGASNDTLYNALAGGLANPMFSNIDLNQDGRQDLFVFDVRESKVLTFLSVKTKDSVRLQYAPQYESAFPKMTRWAFLEDYNGDGKADIFMHAGALGFQYNTQMAVFKNISSGGELKFELIALPLNKETKNISTPISPITVGSGVEIPAVTDIDNDGDIDLVMFDQDANSRVDFYKNMSKELGDTSGLKYYLYDKCWGRFSELENNTMVLNLKWEECDTSLIKRKKNMDAGSTILAIDYDGDGDKDALVSDTKMNTFFLMENIKFRNGFNPKADDSMLNAMPGIFPTNKPVDIKYKPIGSLVDVNGNGSKDFLASPMSFNDSRRNIVWHYNNTSKTNIPLFRFSSNNFLETHMIDWGLRSAPAFLYYNSDSLPDLIIAVQGVVAGKDAQHLLLYINVGTKQKAVFKLEQEDFLGLATTTSTLLTPTIGDVDGDGKSDLLIGNDVGGIIYYKNQGTVNGHADFSTTGIALKEKSGAGQVDLDAGNDSKPALVEMDNDGKPDLLVGGSGRFLAYYKNVSTGSGAPLFEKISDSFLTIRTGEVQLAPCIADLDMNGKPDLLIGTSTNRVYLFADISDTSKLQNPVKQIFYDFKSKTYSDNAPGRFNTLAVAFLDQDAKPDILMGNVRGGLYFLGSTNNGQPMPLSVENNYVFEKKQQVIHIYPNPAKQNIILQFQEAAPQKLLVSIADVSGKQIWQEEIYTQGSSKQDISLPQLANGLYFVKINNFSGSTSQTHKLFIAR